ncbi:uncharacterized protein N7446_008296 [Penicillium canescens]|uniref:DNA replication factor Cdt1 C-terminal domain-containing protein n=1 Tax=Penicillium canescens TaxID=5083 RepID=A0AAD6IN34_PENCN|nr:uncharacterized protein N7446_008296 [Penicillium canescens]KAJ6033411.1 hypothetical protein N7444_011182 [Penicillium canescens]KAJ6057398.1 hypothetical protein N7460_000672 [Penicillium canescens]KAJ6058713.1 hypothetical protein N7446_008296 [Penicillium canescens]
MRTTRASAAQPAIQIFTRATKAGIAPSLPGKSLPAKSTSLPVSPSKKRKLQELENVDAGSPAPVEEGTPSKTLRLNELSVSSPRSGHFASPKGTPKRTPSRRARAPVKTDPSTPATPSKQRTLDFEKIAPVQEEISIVPRPELFNDVLNLHSAFVQAFSFHMAHNGVNAPADLREFLGSVTRIWKKRKVQIKDLQRLVWVWERSSKAITVSYRLANYGLGKICVERTFQTDEQPAALQDSFEETLDLLWEKAQDSLQAANEEDRPSLFIETLGLSTVHESLTPFTSFQKGQQRLQDLKGGLLRLTAERLSADSSQTTTLERTATVSRRQGLLDRIKNKELRQSKLPPPPTKKELVRRAAVDRVEEVAGILAMLRPAGYVGNGIKAMFASQRKPYKMDAMVELVRDSIRSPIPREEVEVCLEILADTSVAGNWISIVTVKEMKSVVLKSCKDVSAKNIGMRAAQLKADWDKSASCVKAPAM